MGERKEGVVARTPQVARLESELEEFFDLSIDPLSIVGFDGEFKRVNASFLRLVGYSQAELFSRSVLDYLHPDDVERAREALAHVVEGQDVAGFEALPLFRGRTRRGGGGGAR